jgi:hypothetical protein
MGFRRAGQRIKVQRKPPNALSIASSIKHPGNLAVDGCADFYSALIRRIFIEHTALLLLLDECCSFAN